MKIRLHFTILLAVGALLCGLPPRAFAQNAAPLINQPLVPDATVPGGPGFTLTLNGTGFEPGDLVKWNGRALATTFVTASQLTATVPAKAIATASTDWVTAVNPRSEGTSNLTFFSVTRATPTIFFQGTDFSTASSAESVVTGDFNGDGILDLAVSDDGNSSVSVLLGNGDGTFQPHVDYAVGHQPSTLVTTDFNGDGILDLAVRNQGPNTVSVLLGNGDGTFQPQTTFATGVGGGRMLVADFNGDGNMDMATTNNPGDIGSISILLGNGDGTFQSHLDFATGKSPVPIAVGDVNGDGKLDLIVGDIIDHAYAVLLGNGDGTFQPFVGYPTLSNPQSVVLADFNGDGRLDLAVFSETSGGRGTAIYLGRGDGTFRGHSEYSTGCGSDGTDCTATVADLNADGHLDIIVRDNGGNKSNTVSIFLGRGDGTFQNPIFFGTGSQPEQVAVGDFNGDGRLDLAVADLSGSAVSVLLQPLNQ